MPRHWQCREYAPETTCRICHVGAIRTPQGRTRRYAFAKSGTLTPEEARAETPLPRVKTQLNMNHFNKMCHFKISGAIAEAIFLE